jgi:glucokinase
MPYALAADIGGTKIALAALDSALNIVRHGKISAPATLTGDPADGLAAALRHFCAEIDLPLSEVAGVGIGFPGVMDQDAGVIVNCPNLPELNGQPLGSALSSRIGRPVHVENDVNLIAVGEHQKGAGVGVREMAAIFVGSGIGCGLILNDALYVGADGAAGEFGHIPVVPDGLPCTCGLIGCLEMYCSGKALAIRAAGVLDGSGRISDPAAVAWTAAEGVISAARAGNPAAEAALRQAFTHLGIGIASLVNLLNPRLIVLGGGVVSAWPEGVQVARETALRRARTVIRDRLQVAVSTLGESAGLIGGAALAFQRG